MSLSESELLERLRRATAALVNVREERDQAVRSRTEPIAIVGAGCRLPGGVAHLAAFWELLDSGTDAVGPIPAARFDVARVYDADPTTPGTTYVREGAFLEAVDRFDPEFFGISPREAAWLDPQHRLIVECAWEALEDAGVSPDRLRKDRVGVYMGIGPSDYAQRITTHSTDSLEGYAATGAGTSFSAGRLSFLLGLQGPSLAVDTACSSSLVALHLGCQGLLADECTLALVGGVQVMLTPEPFVLLSRLHALAPDGRCKSFSDQADGYGRGEGCGVVALKRLSHAERDGDRILALIKGSAINHDGPSSGLTTPNGSAQRQVIQQALMRAGVSPTEVDYVEAHGTGTPLGDPIELEALADVYGRARTTPLRVGTVKTNIGHLESASGIAGVLKVIASLRRGALPASLHSDRLSSHVDWASLPVRVVREKETWCRGVLPRRAGVSSFGMSGTNAHVVLEEAPVVLEPPVTAMRPAELLVLSAKTARALDAVAAGLRAHLDSHPEAKLRDMAFSLATTRAHHAQRMAISAGSRDALREALDAVGRGQHPAETVRGELRLKRGKLAFLFTGQGSQVPGMGRGLYEGWAAFREAFDGCASLFEREQERPLREVMWSEEGSAESALLDQTAYTQSALFALEVSLAALWRSWGVVPELVAGHSIGELAAAYVAGVFSLEDAVRLVAARGRLMQALPAGGAMVSIAAPEADVAAAVAGHAEQVSMAAVNGPQQVVIAGETRAVTAIAEGFASRGVRTKTLRVSHAFHSPLMAPMLEGFQRVAESVKYRRPTVTLVSNVSGTVVTEEVMSAGYWVRHVREAVRFADGVRSLHEAGARTYVEIGPKATLLSLVPESLDDAAVALIPSLRADRAEAEAALAALGSWYVRGGAVDWKGVCAEGARRVELPTYPWQRERHWVDVAPRGLAPAGTAGRWPLAGVGVIMPGAVIHHVLPVGIRHQAFLCDHVVFGKVVVAGAFHISVILAIAAERWPDRAIELNGVEFLRAIVFDDPGQEVELHAVLTPEVDGPGYQFELATLATAGAERRWTTHARGQVVPTEAVPGTLPAPDALEARATEPCDSDVVHAAISASKIERGPSWRWVQDGRIGPGVSLATLVPAIPNAHAAAPLHPVLVDNGFVVCSMGSVRIISDGTTRVPFAVDRLRWWRAPRGNLRCGVLSRPSAVDISDFVFVDEDGQVVAEVEGFGVRQAPRDAFFRQESNPAGALYQLHWSEAPLAESPPPSKEPEGSCVVVARSGSALAARLAAQLGGSVLTEASGLGSTLAGIASVAAVVCLWESADAEETPAAAQRVAAEGLSVVQAVQRHAPARLVWVTSGAVSIGPGEAVEVATTTAWGLGRTVMQEYPELGCRLVDLGGGEAVGASASTLARELSSRDGESQVAWRGGRRHVARLVRAEAVAESRAELSTEGTVLVTGGLGALGLHVARWLAGEGVAHLVLTGRRGLDTPGAAEAVAELEALGARVTVAGVDVAEREALGGVIAAIPSAWPLRGVVHAAGVLDDGLLLEQTAERFARVFTPKVGGAWNLHELTAQHELDFFVLFSSASGLLGAAGQGNYAAANTFLDGLAVHRRAQGLPGQSLAWGPWSEGGMASGLGAAQQARLARQGMSALSAVEGIALFARALGRAEAQLGVVSLDLKAVSRALGASVPPVWRSLVQAASARSSAASAPGAWAARLSALSPERRTEEVRAAVQAEVARVLSLSSPGAVPLDRPLSELGLDSLMAVELRKALGQRVGVTLPATIAFDYPTVDALTRRLLEDVTLAPKAPAKVSPKTAVDEPIAILGIGCRYPGGITSPESFWRLLDESIDAMTEVPKERWDVDALHDADPSARGKTVTRCGGFVTGIDQFEPSFFGISPREAVDMDPQQRLLLETSWEAIERAGIVPEQLMGSDTGVFVGLMYQDYVTLGGGLETLEGYVTTGTAGSVASGRISYVLGLKGPSLTVDTACSSSLVTVHLACQALRQGECSLALAGAAVLMLTPAMFVEFSRLRGLSPDGRCKSFSAAADGVAWSEGCGMLVLKRLSDAQRDGDPILAVIRGSAVNQDGRSNGLTAPNGPSQQAVIQRALAQAGVAGAELDYVECHGTGTSLGDPIEVQALGAALGAERSRERPVWIGSVKSNMGHTQAAAGVAGIMKVVLSMGAGRIPKNLHFDEPSPHIPWSELPVKVVSESVAWPKNGVPRRAGVSSFGISGTNAHVVLEEAPEVKAAVATPARGCELVVLSAKSEAALSAQAAALSTHLSVHEEQSLGDVAYSLATTRSAMEHRLALSVSSRASLQVALAVAAVGQTPAGAVRGTASSSGKLAFLFTGQGSQVPGMGRGLYEGWAAFREAFDVCATLFEREQERPLREVMWSEEGSAESALLDQTAYTQSALFALEVSLAALWRSWGVVPELVAGHSIGELAAAYEAGVFSLEDAVRLVAARGRLMQALPAGGAMVSIAAPEADVAAAVAAHAEQVSMAAVNGPQQVVIAGETTAVAKIAEGFASRGVRTKTLRVSHAFHSPLMAPMLEGFQRVAESVRYRRPTVTLVSNVSGTVVTDEVMSAEYWVRHVREAVRFADGVRSLHEAGARTYVEIGPKATLLSLVPESLPGEAPALLASLRAGRDETVSVLEALGGFWSTGGTVAWSGLFPTGAQRVLLPTYPWQRERYWVETPANGAAGGGLRARSAGHPLFGAPQTLSTSTPAVDVRGLVPPGLATGTPRQEQDHGVLEVDWEPAAAPAPAISAGRFLLRGGGGVGSALRAELESAGHAVVHDATVDADPNAVRARLADAFGAQSATAVVHLGSLDHDSTALDAESVERGLVLGCDSVLATVQALAGDTPRLWLVTRGAQAVGGREVAAAQAPLLGLARVIAVEYPQQRCACVDLDPLRPDGEIHALLAELLGDGAEEEVVLRGEDRLVSRLVRRQLPSRRREKIELAGERSFRLELDEPGVLERLVLRPSERRAPSAGEVEIEVEAAGLDVFELHRALGVTPDAGPGEPVRFGTECAGRVVAVGEGVEGLAVGQSVVALASSAFASHVTTSAELVLPRPPDLPAIEAAATAIAYLTAWYALDRVAHLRRGERVLIHAASGGVGLAAVLWAQQVGAEIYATADSPEKRTYLESLGLKYVSESRSDQFVADVRRWTGGEGVDVVLNSLAGEFAQKGLDLLRSHGRFVELGERDDQPAFRPALRNLSLSLLDLRAMIREQPARVRALFTELLALLAAGAFAPLPITTFPMGKASEAFRKMADAEHFGQLVATLPDPEARIHDSTWTIRADASYLVTGGLGGLGLSMAAWLAAKGAGHLVLVGRSGARSVEQQASLVALEALGARVTVAQADVADLARMERVFRDVAASGMPLRGIVHTAGVLDDGLLQQQTPARLRTVMAPKAQGALNLHLLTREMPLDFFVLYASAAGLLGAPGQGNYAAANTFLDALAHHRQAQGLAGLSIDWGAFSEVGLAAASQDRGARLAARGMRSIAPDEGLRAVERFLDGASAQVGLVPLDVQQWVQFYPAAASSRRLSRLMPERRAGAGRAAVDSDLLVRLAVAAPNERAALLLGVLRAQASQVLRIPEDQLDVDAPLPSLGMDSLMGLELRNRIDAALGISMPANVLWTYPTVAGIARSLVNDVSPVVRGEGGGSEPDSLRETGTVAHALVFRAVESPRARLLCFHGVGGSPEAFRPWVEHVPSDVEVVSLWHDRRWPGDHAPGGRYLEEVCSLIRGYADAPFALVGLSLGSVFAWRIAAKLATFPGGPTPAVLFLYASPLSPRIDLDAQHDQDVMRQIFGPGAAGHERAVEQLRIDAKADFRLAEAIGGYPGESRAPRASTLSIPIVAAGGLSDALAPPDHIRGWPSLTTARSSVHFFPGDHRFLFEQAVELARFTVTHFDGIRDKRHPSSKGSAQEHGVGVTTEEPRLGLV